MQHTMEDLWLYAIYDRKAMVVCKLSKVTTQRLFLEYHGGELIECSIFRGSSGCMHIIMDWLIEEKSMYTIIYEHNKCPLMLIYS